MKRSRSYELNPNLWDINGILKDLLNAGISFEANHICSVRLDINLFNQEDANKAFNIIYGEMKANTNKKHFMPLS